MDIPVYVIAGFLDAGKTQFINGTLTDGFAAKERTLLLRCEEGEEDYDPTLLRNVTVVDVEDEEGRILGGEAVGQGAVDELGLAGI